MKKLLAAALLFVACEQPAPKTEAASRPAAVVVVPKKVDAPKPAPTAEPVAIDPLAIAHDQPNVDHLERAQALKADGDFKGALTEARRALFNNSDDAQALKMIADLAPRSGQYAFAADAYGRLAEQDDDDAVPCIAEARMLMLAKNFTQASLAARDAVRRDAQNVEAWQVLGRAHLSAGDLPSAIVAFEKAVEIAPTHGYALNNLGLAYLRANENPSAVQVLEHAAEQLPNVAYVQNNLGVAYERVGRVEEAQTAYSRATLLSPKYVKAKINAARVAKLQVTPDMVEDPTPDDATAIPEPTEP